MAATETTGQVEPDRRAPRAPRPARWASIRLKLMAFVALLLVAMAAILSWSVFALTEWMMLGQIQEQLQVVANDRRTMILSYVGLQSERMARVANQPRLSGLLRQRAENAISEEKFRAEASVLLNDVMRDGVDDWRALWLADPNGKVLAATDDADLGHDLSRDMVFRAGRQRPSMGDPNNTQGRFLARLAAPIANRDGTLAAVVMARMDTAAMIRFLSDSTGLGHTGEVIAGCHLGDSVHEWLPSRLSAHEIEGPSPLLAAVKGQNGFVQTHDRRGVPVFAVYRAVGHDSWGLVAKVDVAEAYAPIARLRWTLIAIGCIVVAAGVGGSYMVADWFTRPVMKLADTAVAVAKGNLEARAGLDSSDEIGQLGAAFDHMAAELAASHATLERRVAERTKDLEASRDLLDEFFTISTAIEDPKHLEKTFDLVLRCCERLDYDLAMLSLIDRDRHVVRAVKAAGTFAEIVGRTVRPLDGGDILSIVAREGHTTVVADATLDPRCDQEAATMSGIHGLIVLPLRGRESILGTLQVGSRQPIDPETADLRPLETLASQVARALEALSNLSEIHQLNRALEERSQAQARSETALLQQTRILQLILDCLSDGVVVADEHGKFVLFNPAAERILGMGAVDVPTEEWSRQYGLFQADGVTPCPAEYVPLTRAIHGESVDEHDLFIRHATRPAGLWISVNARPLRDEEDQLQGGVAVFRDITERKRTERRQAAQLATTQVLADSSSIVELIPKLLETIGETLSWDFAAFWRVDSQTNLMSCVETWHRASVQVAGFEAETRRMTFAPGVGIIGHVWSRGEPLWVPDITRDERFVRRIEIDEGPLRAALAFPVCLKGKVVGLAEFFSGEVRQSDGDMLEMLAGIGTQIGQFVERDQMHTRVVQAEKMASLGLMSAGVAHEINNPLAYVANNLAVVERDARNLQSLLSAYAEAMTELEEIRPELAAKVARVAEEIDLPYLRENILPIVASTRKGVKRVADIVHNLRGFARLDQAALDHADIHEAITASLEMIRGRLDRRGIGIELNFQRLPSVPCSPAQINQVFLNLLVNAMQAIESSGKTEGRLVVNTRFEPETGTVVVEIEDNGCGIPPNVLPRIFDPFFTTKTVGEGTGLGLSITHGIVSEHGGRIEVESTLGQGTRFRVRLPIVQKGKTR